MTQLLLALLTTFAVSFTGTYIFGNLNQDDEIRFGSPVSNVFRNILPSANGTYDIGSTTPSAEWKNIYTQNLTVSGTCSGCGGATSTLLADSNTFTGSNTFGTMFADVIGSTGNRVNTIYADLVSTQWLEVSANVIDSSLKIGSSTNAVASSLLFENTGGTGTLTYSTGDAFSLDKTLTLTSGAVIAGASTTIPTLGSGLVATNNGRLYNSASTTFSTGLTYSAGAVTCDTASGSVFGCLASADWTTFNSKQATISVTYPLQLSGATISTAFGTTTNNVFAGTQDFSGATVKSYEYPSFTYATSTTWTGTTTVPLGPAYVAETFAGLKCYTDTGTVNVSIYDGTNRMDLVNASTTVGTFTLTTNNTFTASEKRYVDIGTPASTPTKVSCTVSKLVN